MSNQIRFKIYKYKFLVSYYFKNKDGQEGYGYRSIQSKSKLLNLFGNDNFVEKQILKLNCEHKSISFIAVSAIYNDDNQVKEAGDE